MGEKKRWLAKREKIGSYPTILIKFRETTINDLSKRAKGRNPPPPQNIYIYIYIFTTNKLATCSPI